MKKLFLIFLVLLIACPAWGATKTVCGSGCDYTTIAAAEAGATAGDTVNVSTGTYNENNPTFAKALTWVAVDGNGTVTVTNSGTGTYASTFTGNNATINITGFVFDALNSKSIGINFSSNAQNKTISGATIQNAVDYTIQYNSGHSNINIIDSTINEPDVATNNGVIILGTPVGTITGSTFNVYALNWFAALNSNSNLTFTNNIVTAVLANQSLWDFKGTNIAFTSSGNTYDVTSGKMVYKADRASTGGSISISDDTYTLRSTFGETPFRFHTPAAWTISIVDTSITLTNASFSRSVISFRDQINPLVDNTTITTTAQTNTGNYPAISVLSSGTDCTAGGTVPSIRILNYHIYSNMKGNYYILVGTEGTGAGDRKLDGAIIRGGYIYGYNYYSPTATDGTCHGIFVGHNVNADISYNTCFGCPYGVALKGTDMAYTYGGYKYNLCVNCGLGVGTSVIGIRGISNIPIYNNTTYNDSVSAGYQVSVADVSSGHSATGTKIKNNLFYSKAVYMVNMDANSLASFESDNNLYYSSGGSVKFSVNGGSATKTYAEWQALGYDTNSVNADPLFISNGVNFHLQSGSPAKGAGVDVGLSNTNPPDIGAEPYQQYVPWVR